MNDDHVHKVAAILSELARKRRLVRIGEYRGRHDKGVPFDELPESEQRNWEDLSTVVLYELPQSIRPRVTEKGKRVEVDKEPRLGDMVTGVEWVVEGPGELITLTLEAEDAFHARHLLARPRRLVGYALRVWWRNVKLRLLGEPLIDQYERVSDALGERS